MAPTFCNPFKCDRFLRLYEKLWDKAPCDIIFLRCPNREGLKCNKRRDEDVV